MRLFWLIILGLPMLGTAQVPEGNLIPNWSFEDRTHDINGDPLCSTGSSSIYHAQFWGNAHGSVDYLHVCHNEENPTYGVPFNVFGSQEAFDGDAYVHLALYASYFDDAREFLWLNLPDSLEQGQGYSFRMRVSRSDSTELGVDKIGVLFTKYDTRLLVVNHLENEFFEEQPQIETPNGAGNVIDYSTGWGIIEGRFVADGGEKYLTIGSFHPDNLLFVQQFAPLEYNQFYGWMGTAGYYVDALELYVDNSIGITKPNGKEFTFSIYPNPATTNLTIESRTPLAQVWLRDVAGRVVLPALYPSRTSGYATIDVSGLPSGIYLVEVLTQNGQRSVQKVVVE